MADDYHDDNEIGGAIATSEDISVSRRGIDGDKDNLIDCGEGNLFKRKNVSSDPEAGIVNHQGNDYSQSNVIDSEGSTSDDGTSLVEWTQSTMGTLAGVFSPVSLSMFSSLLFLRVGYIVGNAGFALSMMLLVVAYLILGLTILSICAIATNGAVKGGGVYFMISRTLGPELGGSIGVLFWAANTVGSALFATGCIEAVIRSFGPDGIVVQGVFPDDIWVKRGLMAAVLLLTTIISIVGPGAFGKVVLGFLAIVCICTFTVIWSYFGFFTKRTFMQEYSEIINGNWSNSTGIFRGLIQYDRSELNSTDFISVFQDGLNYTMKRDCSDPLNTPDDPNPSSEVTVFILFGVLFSGVTGILAGANLSGELKDPSRSIPRGTISGTTFTFITYFILFLLTSLSCNRELLYYECMFMYRMDFWGPSVCIGTACATLCASLSCLLGASRVLHAVGKDNLFGVIFSPFNWEYGASHNPVVSVLFTSFIVALLFFFPSLNAISQLCSVLYLLSYSAINASCFFLDAFSAPNFRPTFKFYHAGWSALGFILTLVTMFLIKWGYALGCLAGCFVITIILSYFSPAVRDKENNWGSIVQNLLLHQVRKYLLKLDTRKDHVKYWRPHIIFLVSNPRYRCTLIQFVNAIKKGGLYVLGHVHVLPSGKEDPDIEPNNWRWLDLIDHLKIKAFAEVTVAPSYREGAKHLVRIAGVGALKPNTVVLGFPRTHGDNELVGNDKRRDYFSTEESAFGFSGDEMRDLFPLKQGIENYRDTEIANEDRIIEFIRTIEDIIRIGKNVIVCRNFDNLKHESRWGMSENQSTFAWCCNILQTLFRKAAPFCSTDPKKKRKRKYIDVWLVDFFSEPDGIINDRKHFFMLQMAYIAKIAHVFKGHYKLRILIRVLEGNGTVEEISKRAKLEYKLNLLLSGERIKAERAEVMFDDVYKIAKDAGCIVQDTREETNRFHSYVNQQSDEIDGETRKSTKLDMMKIPDEFMSASNKLILERCKNTAITFMYIQKPPISAENMDENESNKTRIRYFELLSILTENLPPTVLVHGLHAVTSTAI